MKIYTRFCWTRQTNGKNCSAKTTKPHCPKWHYQQ